MNCRILLISYSYSHLHFPTPSMSSSSFNLLFRCQFYHAGRFYLFAHWHNESHGMALVGGALSPLSCLRSHVRLMYQSPRDSIALWLEQPTIHPNYRGLLHRTATHTLVLLRSHTRADTDSNSKGDAAVTRALSQGFSVFVPPAMFPDVKPLIKLKPVPLEHSTLPAIFFN